MQGVERSRTTNTEQCPVASELFSADRYVDRAMVEEAARQLLAERTDVGFEYKTAQTYVDDARTALFEALTASGHLSRIEITGTLVEIHEQMITVLCNAYNQSLPGFEKERRYLELCEELTQQAIEVQITEGLLSKNTQIATISDIPSEIQSNTLTKLGYRGNNHKGMLRSRQLVAHNDGTYTRVTEQISRSNSNGEETERFLLTHKVTAQPVSQRPEARVLGTQLIHEMEEGVVGLQRILDQYKGAGVRYGESVNVGQIPYKDLREESARRERQAETYIEQLALYMRQLDMAEQTGVITSQRHTELLAIEIHRMLQAICVMCPEYAKDCFGEASAETYEVAASMAAAGDVAGASGYVADNSGREGIVILCGMSISSEEAKKGITPDSLNWLVRLGLETWQTRLGSCRVPECTSPRLTEVGPCDVCTGQCEPLFNRGWSITQIVNYYRSLRLGAKKFVKKSVTVWDIFKSKSSKREKI